MEDTNNFIKQEKFDEQTIVNNIEKNSLQKIICRKIFPEFNTHIHEIIEINKKKLIYKNVITSKSFNVYLNPHILNEYIFEVYDKIYDNLKKEKLNIYRGENTHNNKNKIDNLSVVSRHITNGDSLPIKCLRIENKNINFPRNKINIFMIYRSWPIMKSSNSTLIEYLLTKILKNVSYLILITNLNFKVFNCDDKFKCFKVLLPNFYYINSFDEELLKISRILNFDTNDEVSFIIYNKNFEILWKGSSSQNNINFNEADKIFFEYQSDVTPKQKEKRVDENINIGLSLLEKNNENLVNDKVEYKLMKNELNKIFNKKYLKSKCESITGVKLNFSALSKFSHSNITDKFEVYKKNFKSTMEYNYISSMKNKTGLILDEFFSKFRKLLNINKFKNEELKKYLKSSCDFYRNLCLKFLDNIYNVKFCIKKYETIGLVNINLNYKIINETPLNHLVSLDVYLSKIWNVYQKYYLDNKSNKELKKQVHIGLNWDNFLIQHPNYTLHLVYFDQNKIKKLFTPELGTNYILFIFKSYENYIFQEHMPLITVAHRFKRNNKNIKLEIKFAIIAESDEIYDVWNNSQLKIFMKFCKIQNSDILFTPRHIVFSELLKISSHLQDIFISSNNRMRAFGITDTNDFYFFLESLIYNPMRYKISQYQYKNLKEYGRKLMRIKLNGLNYQPIFYLKLFKSSSIKLDQEKGYIGNKYYDKSDLEYGLQIYVKTLTKDKNTLEPFLNKIKTILNVEDLYYFENLTECFDIPLGQNCSKCSSTKLGLKLPHFYCYFCNIHFCYDCGNNYSLDYSGKISSIKNLPHEHYLVYIDVSNDSGLKNIETYKFGCNIFHEFNNGTQNSVYSNYICGICYKENDIALRYICINCRPGPYRGSSHFANCGYMDICPKCFFDLKHGKIKNEKYLRQLEIEQHDCESHIFLRVDFSTGDYSSI